MLEFPALLSQPLKCFGEMCRTIKKTLINCLIFFQRMHKYKFSFLKYNIPQKHIVLNIQSPLRNRMLHGLHKSILPLFY